MKNLVIDVEKSNRISQAHRQLASAITKLAKFEEMMENAAQSSDAVGDVELSFKHTMVHLEGEVLKNAAISFIRDRIRFFKNEIDKAETSLQGLAHEIAQEVNAE